MVKFIKEGGWAVLLILGFLAYMYFYQTPGVDDFKRGRLTVAQVLNRTYNSKGIRIRYAYKASGRVITDSRSVRPKNDRFYPGDYMYIIHLDDDVRKNTILWKRDVDTSNVQVGYVEEFDIPDDELQYAVRGF